LTIKHTVWTGGVVLFWARTPHPCSLAWIRAAIRVNRTEPARMYACHDFKVQHNSRIYSVSRGIRMPNPD